MQEIVDQWSKDWTRGQCAHVLQKLLLGKKKISLQNGIPGEATQDGMDTWVGDLDKDTQDRSNFHDEIPKIGELL